MPKIALSLVLGAAVLFCAERLAPRRQTDPLEAIARAKAEFLQANRPEREIELASLAQYRFPELIQATSSLPQSHQYPCQYSPPYFATLRTVRKYQG